MWEIRPRGKFGRWRQATALILLLVIMALGGAMLFGGTGCFSLGAYCVDYTVVMAVALLAVGAFVLTLRRPRL